MSYKVLPLLKDKDGNEIDPGFREVEFADQETGIKITKSVNYFPDPELFASILEKQERGFLKKVELGIYVSESN